MSNLGRLMSPLIRVSLRSIQSSGGSMLLSNDSISVGNGLLKAWAKNIVPTVQVLTPRLLSKFTIRRLCFHKLNWPVRNICGGSLLGMSVAAGSMYLSTSVACAMPGYEGVEHDPSMDEHYSDPGNPSGFLKDDLDNFWALAWKFRLPAVLVMTLFLGWRHPITLFINVVLLLFCTRPSPFSVYVFIEQLRRRAMRNDHGLRNSKVEVAAKIFWGNPTAKLCEAIDKVPLHCLVIGSRGLWHNKEDCPGKCQQLCCE